jgi:hypothetical protein
MKEHRLNRWLSISAYSRAYGLSRPTIRKLLDQGCPEGNRRAPARTVRDAEAMSQAALDSVSLRVHAEQIANSYVPNTGRPSTFEDPDKIQRFLAYLSDGNYRDTACKASGLGTSTLYRLLKLAESGDAAATAFRDAVERTEAQAESDIVRNVRNASKLPQFWAAGATHLERKYPEKWGKRSEESSAPRVIVQVGGNASDVKVLIAAGGTSDLAEAPFACSTQRDSLCISDSNAHSASDTQRYVNQPKDVPSAHEPTIEVPVHRTAGARFAEGPASVPGAPSSAGISAQKARRVRGRAAKDVRARRRAVYRKKATQEQP